MSQEPLTLVVLAAGMGSRYGGLKQIDSVGPGGETLLDYSIFDAMRAGFDRVVFVIRYDIEQAFKESVGRTYAGRGEITVDHAFQELDMLPGSFAVPEGRTKPWGTGHATLVARSAVDGPFAVLNADDFYGAQAFDVIASFLGEAAGAAAGADSAGGADGANGVSADADTDAPAEAAGGVSADAENRAPADADNGGGASPSSGPATLERYAMAGFVLRDTLSNHGPVVRGVCETEDGFLKKIVERREVARDGDAAIYEDESGQRQPLTGDETVSMNFWGFPPSIFGHLEEQLSGFLEDELDEPGSEFLLPDAVDGLISSGTATVRVLPCGGPWFGVTYREDREAVAGSIRGLIEAGAYPERLWD